MVEAARQTSPAKSTSTTKGRPADTSMQVQAAEAERDAVRAQDAADVAAAEVAAQKQKATTVIDYTGADTPIQVVAEENTGYQNDQEYTVRVKYDLPEMTFGREITSPEVRDEGGNLVAPSVLGKINTLSFAEGQRYKVPGPLAAWLDHQDLLYH